MNALELRNISKTYGQTLALQDISVTLAPHRIYGLLGRNGAGKTTLLNILANRLFPTSGEALYGGEPMTENDAVQGKLYSMGEAMPYPESMRVEEVMRICAAFYPNYDGEKAATLLCQFGLRGKTRVKALSTGYASILKLIISLCCNAELLLLDEPVLGLDANHRALFYNALLELYANREVTIVLSTHLIEEAAEIVEEVLIIDAGKLLLHSDVESLRNRAVMVSGGSAAVDAAIIGRNVLSVKTLGAERTAYVMGGYETIPEGVKVSRMGLQELFVQLTNANNKEQFSGVTPSSMPREINEEGTHAE